MIDTIDERAQGVADELGLTDAQREIVAFAFAALACDLAGVCDAWAATWRELYTRRIDGHQLATAVNAMGCKIRNYAQGEDKDLLPR